ncbi:hypothetical protein V5O48_016842, partial [Marasmius crinis-equi]
MRPWFELKSLAKMCSTHEGAPEFVDFNIHAFQRFGTDFNGWLQTVKTHAPGLPNDEDGSQEPASTLQQKTVSLGAATSVAQQKGSQNESKKTRQGKATRKRKRKSDAELEDEEEDSPDLGDDSDELDELNFDQLNGEEDGEGEGEGQREAEPGKRRGVPYSAYELQRLENIERNQQLLAQLGLQSTSSFIRGSKPSTTPESDDVEGTEMRAEPEKPAEHPRPKPQRVLCPSVQKNNGSAGPSPIVDPLTSTSATVPAVEMPLASQPPTSRSQPQPSPCPSPAQLPSIPQPPSGSQPSSPRPSTSPTQGAASPHPPPAQPNQILAPPVSPVSSPAPPSNLEDDDCDDGSNTKGGQNEAMEIDKPRATVKQAYDKLTIPIPTAHECFDPIGSNSIVCRSYGPYLLSKPPNLPNVERPAVWPALVYKWVELQEKWEHDKIKDAVFTTVNRIPAMRTWFNNGRVDRKPGL